MQKFSFLVSQIIYLSKYEIKDIIIIKHDVSIEIITISHKIIIILTKLFKSASSDIPQQQIEFSILLIYIIKY